jgi:gas vesicle protein
MMSFMDRSDLIAMELMQQRQRQRRLEDMLQTSPLADDAGRDIDGRESDVRQRLKSASRLGVWVTSDVLDLVKHLVECGDRCTLYQDAVGDSAVAGYRKHVEDLTFEVFSAVIRLALILEGVAYRIDFEKLAQQIQLLTTVRLERSKELEVICERGHVPKHVYTNAAVEMGSSLEVHVEKMAKTVAGQVEQAIGDRLAAVQSDIVRDIQRSIKEEVTRSMEETQKDLEQKVRDEVQHKVAEAQAIQP